MLGAQAAFGSFRVAAGLRRDGGASSPVLPSQPVVPTAFSPDLDRRRLDDVARLYRLVLQTVPDRPGLRHHADLLAHGSTLAELAASLLAVSGAVLDDRCATARIFWQRAGGGPDGFPAAWRHAAGLADFVADLVRRPPRRDEILSALFPEGVDPLDDDAGPGWGYRLWAAEIDAALFRVADWSASLLRMFGMRVVLTLRMDACTDPALLDATLSALRDQRYGRWRLHLLGSCPEGWRPPVDPRIVRTHATPRAGRWRGVLHGSVRPGDVLSPFALSTVALAALRRPRTASWRTDEDRIDGSGVRSVPFLERSAGLVLRRGKTGPTQRARHLPWPLLHRFDASPPMDGFAEDAIAATSVSLVIATRDQPHLLRRCVESIRLTTAAYAGGEVEIVLVDNGSENAEALALLERYRQEGCTVIRHPGAFNWSALCNDGARHARGATLVFLNNDIECFRDDWLQRLVCALQQRNVGAAGAKLLFADGRVQHNGVVIERGPTASHRLDGGPEPTPFHRRVSAVTGACLAVRSDLFTSFGGFDETLPVTWNDLDFCFRLRRGKLDIVVAASCVLRHDEMGTRTPDHAPENTAQLARSLRIVRRRHGRFLRTDRFLHPFLLAAGGTTRLDPAAPGRVAGLVVAGGLTLTS